MKKYIAFLSIAFLLGSCKKFLDQEPHTLTSAAYWQTADQAEAALAGAYTPLQQEESVGGEEWCSMEAFSDIGYLNDNYPDFIAMANYATNQNTEGDLSLNSYIYNFQIMKRTSDILANVPAIVMDDAQKTRILGEANFLKAFAYFTEVKRYGGIPIYDPADATSSTVRATADQIWTIIETALTTATTQVQWTHEEGRPGLGAVWGLLAKVYAYESKWPESKAAAETVINSGNHSLVPTYSWLWSIDHQTTDNFQENLWVLGARRDGPDPITGAIYLPNDVWGGTHPEPLGNGWRLVSATNNFYDSYEPGDNRKHVTVAKRNVDVVTYMGATDVLKAPNNQSDVVCVKFMQPWEDGTYQGLQPGLDIPVIRYADVLLLDAEAIMNLNGGGPANRTVPVPAAEIPFNLVHERAGLAHIAAPTFNDLMYDRKMELAFEGGERFFDLVRWGLAAEVLNGAPVEGTYKPARTFVAPKNNLLPYPQREIDVSNGTILQNPGY
jgi:starch-binding outer membrane protein, SusD/RagB family